MPAWVSVRQRTDVCSMSREMNRVKKSAAPAMRMCTWRTDPFAFDLGFHLTAAPSAHSTVGVRLQDENI